jgi:hypothetical protein
MNIHQAMEAEYRVRRGKKLEDRRRGQHVGGQYVAQSTGASVYYCQGCGSPVVNSNEGRAAHVERMPACRSLLWTSKWAREKSQEA